VFSQTALCDNLDDQQKRLPLAAVVSLDAWKQEPRGCTAGVATPTFPWCYGSSRTSVIRYAVADRCSKPAPANGKGPP
jgi:hypothetical protein